MSKTLPVAVLVLLIMSMFGWVVTGRALVRAQADHSEVNRLREEVVQLRADLMAVDMAVQVHEDQLTRMDSMKRR